MDYSLLDPLSKSQLKRQKKKANNSNPNAGQQKAKGGEAQGSTQLTAILAQVSKLCDASEATITKAVTDMWDLNMDYQDADKIVEYIKGKTVSELLDRSIGI